MKAIKFDSFGEYEAWADTFDNAADYQAIPAIIDDGWKVAADFFTECKSAKTAIRRFVRVFSEIFPDVKDWGEGMLESIESGYWNSDSHGYQDAEEERRIANTFGAFSWGIEEAMDGEWYIYLNVSGEYAGRGQKAPAARYTEQVEQADSLGELDSITETAANDDTISTAEYEEIHAAALRKAQEWDPQNQQEAPSRPMYKTIPEALAIFDELDPASIHTISEGVSGETMTGTPAELVRRIIEQDKETGGNISHRAEAVEACAIIEAAYAIAGNEAVTNQDGTHKWVGLHGRG